MLRRLLPLAVIAIAILGFIILKATRPEAPQVEVTERAWRVNAVEVKAGNHHPEYTLYGRIESPDRLHAAAPVSGRILQVAVRDGERVEAGQLLVAMDPRDLQPRLVQARTELEREKIRYRQDLVAVEQERELFKLAEAKVERARRLLKDRLGSESNLDQAREDRARARLNLLQREQAIAEHPSRLAQLQSRVEEAERDVERAGVTAPFAARVGSVDIAPGDQVGSGQTLLSLYPLDGLYLRARLPERYMETLQQSLIQQQTLSAMVAYGGREYPARLERIGVEADVRGVEAWLRLHGEPELPIGAVVSAQLQGPELEQVFALPFAALHGGDRIYRIEDGRLIGMQIDRLGERRHNGQVEMLIRAESLEHNSPVMSTHLPNAIDGLRVEVAAP